MNSKKYFMFIISCFITDIMDTSTRRS